MSKICGKCGYAARDDETFCIRCGNRFSVVGKGEEKETDGTDGSDVLENGSEQVVDSAASEPAEERESGNSGGTVSAEWQGAEGAYGSGWREEMNRRTRESDGQIERQKKDARRLRALSRRKLLFALSVAGLLLDFICGIGAAVCLPAAIAASVDFRCLYRADGRVSAQLLWAMTIGYVGAVLGILFLILML